MRMCSLLGQRIVAGAALFVAALWISGHVKAQTTGVPCLYEDILSIVSLDVNIDTIRIDGDTAYMLNYPEGVRIYDYSDPAEPVLLSSLHVAGNGVRSLPDDMEIDGTTLYVTESGYGLHAFDVSDPANPVELSVLLLDGGMDDVDIRGDMAYVTSSRPDAFYTIDISDPSAMSVIGTLDVFCRQVCLDGDYAYLAASGYGVHVVDVSDPASPVLVNTIDFQDHIVAVGVSGLTLVAIANGTAPSYTIDVTDPASPKVVGQFSDHVFASNIYFYDGLGYVAGRPSVQVLDFADPSKPELVGTFDTLYDAADIVIADGIATVATTSGAQIYRIKVGTPRSSALLSYTEIFGGLYDIQIVGQHAYIAADVNGLLVLDMSDPLNPIEVGSFQTPTDAIRLFVGDGYVYLTLEQGNLQVVDVSDPAAPVGVGLIDLDAGLQNVCVLGDLAVVATSQGLYVVDVADKQSPQLRGVIDDESGCFDSAAVSFGGYVLWSGCDSGLRVVDVSDPDAPTVVGSYAADAVSGISVQGDIAVLDAGSSGFHVLDLSDPFNPALQGIGPANSTYDARLVDGRYYTAGSQGIRIYDVSNPSLIEPIGFYEIEPGSSRSLEVRDQIAHVLNGQGIYAIDVSDCDADCLADVNGDGSITPTDFTAWINAFNNQLPECDQNSDGNCTPTDFTAWIANFNAGCP